MPRLKAQSLVNNEGMFVKAGHDKQERLSIEEATGEPRLGCLSSLGSQRKGHLGVRFRGLAWDELWLPIVPLVASLAGSLRV